MIVREDEGEQTVQTITSIGVGRALNGWHHHALEALNARAADGAPIRVVTVDMDSHDWLAQTAGLDALIWNPGVMGPLAASLFKERVYFLEHYRQIRVMPSYRTIWHFESKVAQSYFFEQLDLPRPRTVASFDYHDALASARELGLPVVAKKSYGAGSRNVRLIESDGVLERYLQREFAQQLWDEHKSAVGLPKGAAWLLAPWFREKIMGRLFARERHGCAYLQEFIAGNDCDLRLVVVGRRALGCWRANRKNDFRASGGGQNIWDRPVPEDAVRLCLETSRLMEADSLAFDLLFRDGEPLFVEISYGFPAEPAHDAEGHWLLESDGRLVRVGGRVWPQELWVTELMEELHLEH